MSHPILCDPIEWVNTMDVARWQKGERSGILLFLLGYVLGTRDTLIVSLFTSKPMLLFLLSRLTGYIQIWSCFVQHKRDLSQFNLPPNI